MFRTGRLTMPRKVVLLAVLVVVLLGLAIVASIPGVTVRGAASVKSSFNAKTDQLTVVPQPGSIVSLSMSGRVVSSRHVGPASEPVTLQGYPVNSPRGRRLMAANARSLRMAGTLPGWGDCGPPRSGAFSFAGTILVFPVVRLPAAGLFGTAGSVTGEYLWQNYEAPSGSRNAVGNFPEMNSCVQSTLTSRGGFRQTFNAVSLSDRQTEPKTGHPVTDLAAFGFGAGETETADGGSYAGSSIGSPEPIVDPESDPWAASTVDAVWRANPTPGEIGEGTASPVRQAASADYDPASDGPGSTPPGFRVTVTFGFQMHCLSLG